MSSSVSSLSFYADTLESVYGSNDTPGQILGPSDGAEMGLYGGLSMATNDAVAVERFHGTDAIPKFSKITQVWLLTHMRAYSGARKSGANDFVQHGFGVSGWGQVNLQTYAIPAASAWYDLGVSITDITGYKTWSREDFPLNFYTFQGAHGDANGGNTAQGYWDFALLVVSFVHEAEQRMVV